MLMHSKSLLALVISAVAISGCSPFDANNEASKQALAEKQAKEQLISEITTVRWDSDKSFVPAVLAEIEGKPFDIVIENGRVVDPASGTDAVLNVGVVDGRIAAVSAEAFSAKQTSNAKVIDATGLVVAPGFIDTHTHGMDHVTNRAMLTDGTTSMGDLEYGSLKVDEFYSKRVGASAVNYFTAAGHEFARIQTMDGVEGGENTFVYPIRAKAMATGNQWATRHATPEEFQAQKDLLEKELQDGAISISTTIGYFGSVSRTREVWDLQKLAHKYGAGFSGHFRMLPWDQAPQENAMGLKEIMANGMSLGQPVLISHNNNHGWREIEDMLQHARSNGQLVWAEQYPWAAGSPNLGAPPLNLENFKRWNMTPEKNIFHPGLNHFLTTEEFSKLKKESPETVVTWFARPEAWVPHFCAQPNMVIANDALPLMKKDNTFPTLDTPLDELTGHPRASGSRAICLRMAREEGIPLSRVVNNASTYSAKMLCKSGVDDMCERGRVEEGMVADITMFDPETVTETANYTDKQVSQSAGIPHVIVNGQMAVENGEYLQNMDAGQPIRRDGKVANPEVDSILYEEDLEHMSVQEAAKLGANG
ncbi:hypothetical protein [Vibrio superstes]|uniref:D-glutamate deacylase n=1 Tax=Vibrio superstes NBRC 103154 TaxID=1219062 RepID=A0A511QT73_9VIBR|nr:hypothetical protein [Vibrio superstes]GEM80563.1 D-glutamate deacylase [Vibrio superstes NBRC 103154]